MSIAVIGMLASRNLPATAGAEAYRLDDPQIHPFFHQPFGIANCHMAVIPVVQHDQFELSPLRRNNQARFYCSRECGILPLRCVSDRIPSGRSQTKPGPIPVICNLVQEPALMQRVNQPKTRPLVEPR